MAGRFCVHLFFVYTETSAKDIVKITVVLFTKYFSASVCVRACMFR